MKNDTKMPVLFLGHGNPLYAISKNEFSQKLKTLDLPTPKAVLCISAHWQTKGVYATAMQKPKTIHDFYGFPDELYKVSYNANGDSDLVDKLKQLIGAKEDFSWGLDHGCWSVLKHIYPHANINVVQLSLDVQKSPREHFNLAKSLLKLREQGILIVGSGNIVHNLSYATYDESFAHEWAKEAMLYVKNSIKQNNFEALINFENQANLKLAIPTSEHFLPLLYILALKQDDDKIEFFNEKIVNGSIDMSCVKIF